MAFFFLSHSSLDTKEWTRPLADALTAAGHDVFFDERSIEWGGSFPTEIGMAFKELATRDDGYFVPLLSTNSEASYWVQRECAVAEYLQARKSYPFILPVKLPHSPVKPERFFPFPDRVYFCPKTIKDLIDRVGLQVVKPPTARVGGDLLKVTMPFMSIQDRTRLVYELRIMAALEQLSDPEQDVVRHVAGLVTHYNTLSRDRLVVFISGFPGLGKTTLSKNLCYHLGPEKCALLHVESYLRDRSFRRKCGIQGDDQSMYDLHQIDRDLVTLVGKGDPITVPAKAEGDSTGIEVQIEPRPVIIVDGALNFIYDLHLSPDIVVFIDASSLTKLCLSLLRDTGRLPGDRTYSLKDALQKFKHYDQQYYRSTTYIKNRMSILLQADVHHRYSVLRGRRFE